MYNPYSTAKNNGHNAARIPVHNVHKTVNLPVK